MQFSITEGEDDRLLVESITLSLPMDKEINLASDSWTVHRSVIAVILDSKSIR